ILEYLSSGTIRGIGRKTAERIVAAFGAETFNIIENDAAQLATIPGITHSKAVSISNDFKTQNGISRLMEFLVSNELPPSLALHLYRLYGAASIELLHDNPYLLTNMELGVEFYRADKLAMTLGLSGDCMERVEAAVVYELSYNAESGHVFIPRRKLVPVTAKLIDVPYDLVEDTIDSLSDDHVIVIEDVCGETACYLSHLYEAETFVAARLEQLMGCQIKTELDMGETVSRIESAARLSYAPLQREAVCAAANNPVMILTGGPGTGKTTVIQGMLELFSRMGLSVSLAAPTGRAAKRMSEFCGVEAATIHRMLEQDYTDGSGLPTFGKNEGNPLETDVLIIDEMSMVDIMLMRAVLAALPTSCRLVMVGDSDQLPSIGAGNVLKDLIAADIITSIRLTEIFRQAQSSNIVVSAHAINRGEFPDFAGRDSDMFFLQRHDANSVIETTVELCRDRLPKNMGIPASQIQVLTPSRKYDVGTIILNRRLQDALNPASQDKNEHRVGDKLFRVGDRVMQIRNNYDLAWHNLDGADSGL
ncbi:MAG: AAA family ATPase, partial [Clostridia bacterium]